MGKTYSKSNKTEHASNKEWRAKQNRKFRKMSKGGILNDDYPYSIEEVSDIDMAPGKVKYYKNLEEKYKRK